MFFFRHSPGGESPPPASAGRSSSFSQTLADLKVTYKDKEIVRRINKKPVFQPILSKAFCRKSATGSRKNNAIPVAGCIKNRNKAANLI
jgi:hypothetical protein